MRTRQPQSRSPVRYRKSPIMLGVHFVAMVAPISALYLVIALFFGGGDSGLELHPSVTFLYRLVCVGLVLEMVRRYYDQELLVGRRRVLHAAGVASFGLRRTTIAYRDIRDVQVRQSVLGRLFDYGTLQLGTPSTFHFEISFEGLGRPHELCRKVEDRCAKSRGIRRAESNFLDFEDDTLGDDATAGYRIDIQSTREARPDT